MNHVISRGTARLKLGGVRGLIMNAKRARSTWASPFFCFCEDVSSGKVLICQSGVRRFNQVLGEKSLEILSVRPALSSINLPRII